MSHLLLRAPLILLALALGACASPGTRLDTDLEAFTNGVNAIIRAGMPLKEARAVVRERFPDPDSDFEGAPLIATRGNPIQVVEANAVRGTFHTRIIRNGEYIIF